MGREHSVRVSACMQAPRAVLTREALHHITAMQRSNHVLLSFLSQTSSLLLFA